MVDESTIKNALVRVMEYGHFSIKQIKFDEINFGNICIELVSSNHVELRFIRDKGTFWCELGKNGEWYFIEDVFTLIGIDTPVKKDDEIVEFLMYMSNLIANSITCIFSAFDEKKLNETKIRIKTIATERAICNFKD